MKTIRVSIKAIEYGVVEVEVPENCTDNDIIEAARAAEDTGDVCWYNRDVEVTEWREDNDD